MHRAEKSRGEVDKEKNFFYNFPCTIKYLF